MSLNELKAEMKKTMDGNASSVLSVYSMLNYVMYRLSIRWLVTRLFE